MFNSYIEEELGRLRREEDKLRAEQRQRVRELLASRRQGPGVWEKEMTWLGCWLVELGTRLLAEGETGPAQIALPQPCGCAESAR